MRVGSLFILLLGVISANAQDKPLPARNPGSQYVEMDLLHGRIKDDALVPYNVRPLFRAILPEKLDGTLGLQSIDSLSLFYLEGPCPVGLNGSTSKTLEDSKGNSRLVSFTPVTTANWYRPNKTLFGQNDEIMFPWFIKPGQYLQSNKLYCLLVRRFSDPKKEDMYQQTVALRTASKFGDYVKLDFGLGYAYRPNVSTLFASIAIHGYTIAINDDTDLAETFGFWRQIRFRTSLYVGIAPVTLSAGTEQDIRPLTSVGNLVAGIGFRGPFYWPNGKPASTRIRGKFVLQAMRLNAGLFFFSQASANQAIVGNRTKITPYVGLTYDLSLTSLLGPIAKLFGGG